MKPPQIVHTYIEEDLETFEINGEKFVRDYELENTIKKNGLLPYPEKWYEMPPSYQLKLYEVDMRGAFKYEVEVLHKFSWKSLEKDYRIPKKYIDAWRSSKEEK
ncbi:MAG: hypothetical protein O8C62_13100 [Candidatus Methanoperedens sp.]|nr:hypothetical protein [Candidatus Methanoperedens sp.]